VYYILAFYKFEKHCSAVSRTVHTCNLEFVPKLNILSAERRTQETPATTRISYALGNDMSLFLIINRRAQLC